MRRRGVGPNGRTRSSFITTRSIRGATSRRGNNRSCSRQRCGQRSGLSASSQGNVMRTVKAAAVQLSPVLYSREGTVDKVVRRIQELGKEGVQFATFPETVVPYYPYFSFIQAPCKTIAGREHLNLLDQAVAVPSPAIDAISEACQDAGV